MKSIINWISIIMVIVGIGLFLYGANVYDATIGWDRLLPWNRRHPTLHCYIPVFSIKKKRASNGSNSEPVKPTVLAI